MNFRVQKYGKEMNEWIIRKLSLKKNSFYCIKTYIILKCFRRNLYLIYGVASSHKLDQFYDSVA